MLRQRTEQPSEYLWINETEAMKMKIRAGSFRMSLALPTAMAAWAVKWIPQSAFEEMRSRAKPPYDQMVTKETCRMLIGECVGVLKENKGLEIVHVEIPDGTFVSIVL